MFDFGKEIILENPRARLEPMQMHHSLLVSDIALNQKELMKFSPSEINTGLKLKDYFKSAMMQREKGIRYPFMIYDNKVNRYAGSTSFGNVSNEHERIEIGWTWIGTEFQRSGLNRHCKYLLMSYAFEELNFKRVELKTDARNLQSRKAILGVGGKYEGALRSHTVMYDGYRRDTVYYSILISEWPGIKSSIFKSME